MFKEIDSKMDLPKLEEEILSFWDKENIFEQSLEKTKDGPRYSFYDGPPFATGTPHYGHIVASTMKDVVPRFWTMKGHYVPRVWGWDCHGLPIENIAEKDLGITHKKQIEEIGVEKFNAACRSKVLEYVSVWQKVIRRLGRWADMENAYKTMDLNYMESVWWVFKELYDKGLIYEGYRSMHICPRCETTLSQSEVTEGYKDVKDLSAIAKFHLKPGQSWKDGKYQTQDSAYVLAWTTTPWTLIGNVALAVGKDINYSALRVKDVPDLYIVATDRIKDVFKDQTVEIVHDDIKGQDLVGLKYEPLFDYYSKDKNLKNHDNGWRVCSADFVTTEDGTGVVHIAPAFGEDDMRLGQKNDLPFIQHVGMDGIIKSEADDFAGMNVKPADDVQKTDVEIIKYLAHKGLLFLKEKYEHSYPHCWRCDTPLLNYATTSWFVDILKIKDEAIKLAQDINWSPAYIKEGRFGKWLEGARDWSISRQRYWASVIPIWRCDKCAETVTFGSITELEERSGEKVTDLHKDTVDKIKFPCPHCHSEMSRVPDVLDTWFDSGSMPYAQLHYPFENKEKFSETFPAEFIAEGVDQTRAWFYYLHVIATAIKGSKAYENVIVNGIVLAEDGKKMSKRLQNYPDPMLMFDKYGADTMRYYLLTSPVMQAENLNFAEKDMNEIHRGIFRMLWNSYSFFTLYANIDKWQPNQVESGKSKVESRNILDRWIISELNTLIKEVNDGMEKYNLTKTSRLFAPFIDNLSNWYIRRSRKRFWKSESDSDKENAYQTLWTVLVELSKLMAPFTPFIAEEIYKNLTGKESVHLEKYPVSNKDLINKELNLEMGETRKMVELGLSARAANNIKVRQPLRRLEYFGKKLNSELELIIAEEVNVKIVEHGKNSDQESVVLDTDITEELRTEGSAREIVRNIQSLRKNSGFRVEDRIIVNFETQSPDLNKTMERMNDLITKEVLAKEIINKRLSSEGEQEFDIDGQKIWFGLSRAN
jgi:isoleucyl-tRNA synthetase